MCECKSFDRHDAQIEASLWAILAQAGLCEAHEKALLGSLCCDFTEVVDFLLFGQRKELETR